MFYCCIDEWIFLFALIYRHYIAKSLGLEGPVIEQARYSMFDRTIVEYHYLDLFKQPFNLYQWVYGIY